MAVAHKTTCQNNCSLHPKKCRETGVFLLNMRFHGTKFQISVWKQLLKIPKGQTRTYLDIAKALNKPNAARAVANAISKNPYAPKVPCHRVIRTDGNIGGYSGPGGIKTKKKLLKLEGISF